MGIALKAWGLMEICKFPSTVVGTQYSCQISNSSTPNSKAREECGRKRREGTERKGEGRKEKRINHV